MTHITQNDFKIITTPGNPNTVDVSSPDGVFVGSFDKRTGPVNATIANIIENEHQEENAQINQDSSLPLGKIILAVIVGGLLLG